MGIFFKDNFIDLNLNNSRGGKQLKKHYYGNSSFRQETGEGVGICTITGHIC